MKKNNKQLKELENMRSLLLYVIDEVEKSFLSSNVSYYDEDAQDYKDYEIGVEVKKFLFDTHQNLQSINRKMIDQIFGKDK
jgi:hypothetical protein